MASRLALDVEEEKGWTSVTHLLGASQMEAPYIEELNLQKSPYIGCGPCPTEIQRTTLRNVLDPLARMEYVEPLPCV